jgi:hypothetical protein
VKGTVFTLEDDGTATRLSVTEGKVLLVRSSDGASALVTAGQSSAVRGELPLMVTSAGGQRGDGEIIFEDDFDEGLANWRLVIGEMLFDEPVPAADAGRYLQMRRVERDGKMTSCVALDSSTISGEKLLGLRSALPIDEDAWAVELDALVEQKGKVPRLGVAHVSHDPASRGSAVLALIDAEQIRQTEGWMHVRMEFIWSTDASGRRLSLSWRQFLNGAPDGMTSGGAGPSGSSRSSFVIETSNMTFLIDRVVVRRIASPQLKGGR